MAQNEVGFLKLIYSADTVSASYTLSSFYETNIIALIVFALIAVYIVIDLLFFATYRCDIYRRAEDTGNKISSESAHSK